MSKAMSLKAKIRNKTEEYPSTGHFADHCGTTQQITAVSGILHNIEENQET